MMSKKAFGVVAVVGLEHVQKGRRLVVVDRDRKSVVRERV